MLVEALAQPGQIAAHARCDVGIEGGGGESLVLTVFGEYFRRPANRHVGKVFGQQRHGALLVLRIGVGVQKADGDGINSHLFQVFRRGVHRAFVQGLQHLALRAEPFCDFTYGGALDQPARTDCFDVVQFGTVALPDDQYVPEAFGGDHA